MENEKSTINITEVTIAKLDLKPTDVLVFTVKDTPENPPTLTHLANLREFLSEYLMAHVVENNFILLTDIMTATVISKEEAEAVQKPRALEKKYQPRSLDFPSKETGDMIDNLPKLTDTMTYDEWRNWFLAQRNRQDNKLFFGDTVFMPKEYLDRFLTVEYARYLCKELKLIIGISPNQTILFGCGQVLWTKN